MEMKEVLFYVALSSSTGLGTLGYNSLKDTTEDNKDKIEELDKKVDEEKNSNTALHKDVEYNQELLKELVKEVKEMRREKNKGND